MTPNRNYDTRYTADVLAATRLVTHSLDMIAPAWDSVAQVTA